MEAIKGGEVRLAQMQEQLSDVEAAVRRALVREASLFAKLRSAEMKVKNQRIELRRLNRRLQAMWEGVRFAHKVRATQQVRLNTEDHMQLPLPMGPLRSITIVDGPRDLDFVDNVEKQP